MKRRTVLIQSLALVFAGTLGASLTGCGFQLRGVQQQALDIDALVLAAPETALTDSVRRELAKAGVALTDDAPLRLNLGGEHIQQISLRGGDVINDEIELRLSAPFSVQRAQDGAYLLDQQRLGAVTTYLVNNDDPLVRDEQHEAALVDLRQRAARQLRERLRALSP